MVKTKLLTSCAVTALLISAFVFSIFSKVRFSCHHAKTGPGVITLFSFSTQLSMKLIVPINVEMPTTVGIYAFISRINYCFLLFRFKYSIDFVYVNIYEYFNFHVQLN